MKTRILKLTVVVVTVVLLTATISAQLAIRQPLFRVAIPFAFFVGGTHLPAGHYHVYHPGDPYLIVMERDDGRAQVMAYVHPSTTDLSESSTKLVFNKYGNQHFLSQVWTENDPQVHHCLKGQMEQQLLAQAAKPHLVVIAAKR